MTIEGLHPANGATTATGLPHGVQPALHGRLRIPRNRHRTRHQRKYRALPIRPGLQTTARPRRTPARTGLNTTNKGCARPGFVKPNCCSLKCLNTRKTQTNAVNAAGPHHERPVVPAVSAKSVVQSRPSQSGQIPSARDVIRPTANPSDDSPGPLV